MIRSFNDLMMDWQLEYEKTLLHTLKDEPTSNDLFNRDLCKEKVVSMK